MRFILALSILLMCIGGSQVFGQIKQDQKPSLKYDTKNINPLLLDSFVFNDLLSIPKYQSLIVKAEPAEIKKHTLLIMEPKGKFTIKIYKPDSTFNMPIKKY